MEEKDIIKNELIISFLKKKITLRIAIKKNDK